ncbi:MAG: hypothetical protein H7231_03275, partial [Rhodoferax sp.]|nr:hypothetical protein [Actinomycetota bacterium]
SRLLLAALAAGSDGEENVDVVLATGLVVRGSTGPQGGGQSESRRDLEHVR